MVPLPLLHPMRMIISAPSFAGKTTFISQLIKHKNQTIDPIPSLCYFCYTEWQPLYDELQALGVIFHRGLIDVDTLDSHTPKLLVLDDMMNKLSPEVTSLFTKNSHHRNMSVIFTTQNIFDKHREMRTISLNASYLVLFKSPRDRTQISHLARQMRPDNAKIIQQAFDLATTDSYGYLLVDLCQSTPEELRLRNGIFPEDNHYVYIEKAKLNSFDRWKSERNIES